MKTGIRYARWSTLEQGHRDRSSEERQVAATTCAAKRYNWSLDEDTLIDKGRSAFTGENLTKGELGKLTKRLQSGALDPRKTVLIVEELDRLSRQPPSVMQGWMMPLLAMGLTIHIAKTNQTITQDMIDHDIGGYLTLMVQAFSAYDFSRKQRDRGNAAWKKRREAIAEGRIASAHRARKWLRWDEQTKQFVVIPERAKLIRIAVSLLLRGHGKAAVAKTFNQRMFFGHAFFDTWPVGDKKPKLWTATYIKRIANDPAIIGYVQYHRAPRGASEKVPLGKPLKVYPQIIGEETFNRLNDRRAVNQAKHQGKGRNVSNLFGPKAVCARCGGLMQPLGSARYRINKNGSRSQHYFLYCVTAKLTKGAGCSHQLGWAYRKIEQPLLDALLDRALDNQHFAVSDDESIYLEGQVFALRRRVDDQTKQAQALVRLIEPDADGEIDVIALARYEEVRDELRVSNKALGLAQETLATARGKVSPLEHVVRVGEVRARMESEDVEDRYKARSTVKAAIQSIITSMSFDEARGRVTVNILDGLAMLFIHRDGSIMFIDLYKRGRDYSLYSKEDQALIADWARRREPTETVFM